MISQHCFIAIGTCAQLKFLDTKNNDSHRGWELSQYCIPECEESWGPENCCTGKGDFILISKYTSEDE